jgi:hypothetical protein
MLITFLAPYLLIAFALVIFMASVGRSIHLNNKGN